MTSAQSHYSYFDVFKIAGELLSRKLEEFASRYAQGRLIDLGCGARPYEKIFAPYIDSYFGVDSRETAEAHYGESTKADLYADCTDTKLESGSFDTLLSTQVIEHIYDHRKYIAECRRLLRAGGIGIFTIPFVCECHAEPHDYFRFTRYGIQRLFEEQNFTVLDLVPLGGAYATLIQVKIMSLYYREPRNLAHRVFRKLRNTIMVPLLNFLALHLDKWFWNDKLCINYAVVVQKEE